MEDEPDEFNIGNGCSVYFALKDGGRPCFDCCVLHMPGRKRQEQREDNFSSHWSVWLLYATLMFIPVHLWNSRTVTWIRKCHQSLNPNKVVCKTWQLVIVRYIFGWNIPLRWKLKSCSLRCFPAEKLTVDEYISSKWVFPNATEWQ